MDERPSQRWDGAPPPSDGLLEGDRTRSLAARLERWLADARAEGSADARARERWLHAAAEADATFSGVLLDLAERRAPVAVSTSAGRRHHGSVEVIGADFAALRTAGGAEVLLVLAAITSVRTAPLVGATVGERVVTTELRLMEVLAELTTERTRVLLVSADGRDAVAGELSAVGYDVVRLRTDADPPATAYLPAGSIAEVALG
jgi:hypothetical protein